MPVASHLSTIADDLEAEATKAELRGERESAMAMLWLALRVRRLLEPHAVVDIARLTRPNRGGNSGDMVTAERVRVSKGRKKRDALVVAANTHNYTLRSLAEKLKAEGYEVTHALLSQARTGKRSIDGALAKRVEALTGFKASRANWPTLRG